MSTYRNYIIVGLITVMIAAFMIAAALDSFQTNVGLLVLGLLLMSVGGTIAGVGIAAWGVHLGTRELRDLLAKNLNGGQVPTGVGGASKTRSVSPRITAPATASRPESGAEHPASAGERSADTRRPNVKAGALARFPPPDDLSSGWKDDPAAPGEQHRRWDGDAWTEHVQDAT